MIFNEENPPPEEGDFWWDWAAGVVYVLRGGVWHEAGLSAAGMAQRRLTDA
jgi:hypothetical protein